MSTNVGGMGAHWTCACPRPADGERIPFLGDRELDDVLAQAERYLGVRRDVFPGSPEGRAILEALRATYDPDLPPGRRVDPMPLACATDGDGRPYWTGSDVVLGPLAEPGVDSFQLRADTICRRLETDGPRVVAAAVEDRVTGRRERIAARAFFVAADALRTPQLLWASEIRPPALGRYLNDHIQVVSAVKLDRDLVGAATTAAPTATATTRIVGVFWVPFSEPHHPFHGQVMHLDMSPIGIVDAHAGEHVVGLGWFVPKEIRAEDRLVFDREVDAYGMPRMRIEYELTPRDETVEAAIADQRRGARALGEGGSGTRADADPGRELAHYQGRRGWGTRTTVRPCATRSRASGATDNLFVGGERGSSPPARRATRR